MDNKIYGWDVVKSKSLFTLVSEYFFMKKPTHFFDERGGRFCSIFILCFFSICISCYAQKESPPGASSNGMAAAVCALSDADHSRQAVANSAFAAYTSISSNYKNYYLLPELYTSSVVLLIPYKKLCLGGYAERFGPSHYKELRMGLSVAHRIGHTALGLRINWEQLAIEGFPTQQAFTGELGGIVALTPRLNFGGNLYNFTLSSFEHQPLPVILKCGLSGQLLKELTLCVEAEKNTNAPLLVKWGAQYQIAPPVKLLLGFRHPTNSLHAGIAIAYRNIHTNYSLSWDFRLGLSQEFSLAITLKKS
ncbi:MAG: hypothetical protein JWM14_2530 [Chitinophagaceae bacterium]|nr:hypothetical protein [Chitinophagaceae bacterium]